MRPLRNSSFTMMPEGTSHELTVQAFTCAVCHCRYVSEHTVAFWAASYVQDLARSTRSHVAMKCYGLGLGLDTFRCVGGVCACARPL